MKKWLDDWLNEMIEEPPFVPIRRADKLKTDVKEVIGIIMLAIIFSPGIALSFQI